MVNNFPTIFNYSAATVLQPPVSQPTGVCKSVRYISLCGALHSVLAGAFSSEGVCKSVRYISLLVCNTVAAL